MVYKKFKDYKLEIIKLIFMEDDPSVALNRIEELEENNSITPSQVVYLTNLYFKSEIYTFSKNSNVSYDLAKKLNYETKILVYNDKIIASYIPSKEYVWLE